MAIDASPMRRSAPRRLAPALAAVLVVGLTLSLGAWQLRRADEKRALHARAVEAATGVARAIPARLILPGEVDGHRVVVRGEWVPSATVFIDNRTHRGVAGFHVVTPVKIRDSDLHVLVLRGWIPRDPRDRLRLPAVTTPAGAVEIEGLAEERIAQTMRLGRASAPSREERVWQNLDFEPFEQVYGLPLQRVLIRQNPEPADELVRQWHDAGNDVGKHLGYAVQWFALSALTAGLWIYFRYVRRRDQRDPIHPDR